MREVKGVLLPGEDLREFLIGRAKRVGGINRLAAECGVSGQFLGD